MADELDTLIADLYDIATAWGAGEPDWAVILARLGAMTGSQVGLLHVVNPAQGHTTELANINIAPDAGRDYRDYFFQRDIFIQPYRKFGQGELALSQDYLLERHVASSEFYTDFLAPRLGDSFFNAGMYSVLGPDKILFLGLQRARRAGAYEPHHARPLRTAWPHLLRAIRLRERLRHLEGRHALAADALDALTGGVIVLDATRQVIFANRAAERMLREACASMHDNGRLRLPSAQDDNRLSLLLSQATREVRPVGAGMRCPRAEQMQPLTLLVAPFQPQQRQREAGSRNLALVLISDPREQPPDLASQLAPLFGLTRAEAEVGAALAAGQSPEDIAAARRVSIVTIRSQVRALMAKTGTRRQGEVIRLLLSLPRLAGS
ncbi:MAG: putative Transcriptional regulator, LuxR family protein [Roseomonas sp.]|nr:putative Transcriptional regulator, LuxR family protein [Roseomonas sp.]